ncbi:MAG: hypothetical protein Fur0010_03340 [Bdellovibrio sp.]
MEFYHRTDRSIHHLVELGTYGHFPIFEMEWIKEIGHNRRKLTGNEKVKAKKLLERLCDHRSIERKRIVISSMNDDDRQLVVRAFLKLVEGKILDRRPELQ